MSSGAITLVYTAIAVIMTWPLMRHPSSSVASDLGDPLFISWVLMWTGGQVLAALRGDVSALANYWNGNIFYPEPRTIAYSEHFTPQMLQMLPVYAAGGNILLCYNLLFLSTFVVAALGMFLFVRELTGRPLAAFLAGLAFAYAPYRLGQFPHLQVMSIGWMPLALLGLRRFFSTGKTGALAGGAGAFVVQGLSCGYYLLFFAPLFAAYGLYEMVRRRLTGSWRVWLKLAIAAAVVGLVLWPFLRPYLQLKNGGVGMRSVDETVMFAADTHAFVTITPGARLLGPVLPGYQKAEGEGFPGFTILAFALIGLAAAAARWVKHTPWAAMPVWRVASLSGIATLFVAATSMVLVIFVHGRLTLHTGSSLVTIQNATTLLWIVVLAAAALVALGRAKWALDQSQDGTTPVFWLSALALSALLAFGPDIYAGGHLVGSGPYGWLFNHVPGFDALRVPARLLTLVTLALAVLAGAGAATALAVRRAQFGRMLVVAGIGTLMLESWFAPMAINQRLAADGLVAPGVPVVGRDINPLYRMVKNLPGQVIVVEFPFGDAAYDIQATFFAGYHRRPLVNGYSGFFPASYAERVAALGPAPANSDAARRTLVSSGATHALVHQRAFTDGRGHEIVRWLASLGAQVLGTSEDDVLLQLNLR